MRLLTIAVERFPIAGRFTIARGARTEAVVVTVAIARGRRRRARRMRALCPLRRDRRGRRCRDRGAARARSRAGSTAIALQEAMPPGAARNALDCALWDLDAKRSGVPAHVERRHRPPAAGLDRLHHQPRRARGDGRRRRARRAAGRSSRSSSARRRATSSGSPPSAPPRPTRRLIADANEGWTRGQPRPASRGLRRGGLRPHRAAASGREGRGAARASAGRCRSAPTRACTTAHGLGRLVGLYDAVNIKLDKTGGLTEALALAGRGRAARLCAHDRLHGRHLARHGAGAAACAARPLRRPRRPAAPRPRPRERAALRRQHRSPAVAGALGLSPKASHAPASAKMRPAAASGTIARNTGRPRRPEDRAARNRAGRHGERLGGAHHALGAAARRLRREERQGRHGAEVGRTEGQAVQHLQREGRGQAGIGRERRETQGGRAGAERGSARRRRCRGRRSCRAPRRRGSRRRRRRAQSQPMVALEKPRSRQWMLPKA